MNPHVPRHHHGDDDLPPRAPRAPLIGPVLRMTVYLGEWDQYHHRPAYTEIVHRAHRAGLAGASVFRGFEGFGVSSLVHTSRLLDLADDLPLTVVVIDEEDRVRAFLPQVRDVVPQALVTLDPVQAVSHLTGVPHPAAEEMR
jgi:PII-like signaling protein